MTDSSPPVDPQAGSTTSTPSAGQVAGAAGDVAKTATVATGQAAAGVASEAKTQASEVASTAAGGAQQVVQTALDEASAITDEVKAQARNLVNETRDQARSQAETQTERAAESLRSLGDQVRALVDGNPQEGPVRDYAQQAADKLADLAEQLQQRGFQGVTGDVQQFARRRPGMFLLGAAAIGFGAGRILRGSSGDSSPQPAVGAPDPLSGVGQLPMVTPSAPPMPTPPPASPVATLPAAAGPVVEPPLPEPPIGEPTVTLPTTPHVPHPADR